VHVGILVAEGVLGGNLDLAGVAAGRNQAEGILRDDILSFLDHDDRLRVRSVADALDAGLDQRRGIHVDAVGGVSL